MKPLDINNEPPSASTSDSAKAEYDSRTYGDRLAGVYDRYHPTYNPAVVATLKSFAGNGSALELGIGTGRVALPLLEAGVRVSGIDASEAMVAKMRAKPRGESIPVAIGDFADVGVEGRFDLIYVLFNTFFALLTQADQVRCFKNIAQHLTARGVFVMEAFVPDLSRFRGGQDVRTVAQNDDEIRFDVSQLDAVSQLVSGHHVVLSERGTRLYPVKVRFAWPAELDLMAQVAGLSLNHRWEDWERRPFTGASTSHVSVYHP
jgi:SAM-dependent methyltransferase